MSQYSREEVREACHKLDRELQHVTYKPGWTFSLEMYDETVFLRVVFPAPDANQPRFQIHEPDPILEELNMGSSLVRVPAYRGPKVMSVTVLDVTSPLPLTELQIVGGARSHECFVHLLHEVIELADRHERDEFLRHAGVRVRDPHPEFSKTPVPVT